MESNIPCSLCAAKKLNKKVPAVRTVFPPGGISGTNQAGADCNEHEMLKYNKELSTILAYIKFERIKAGFFVSTFDMVKSIIQ